MKILMIAPQPFFEPRGTPFSVLGRLRALSHLGHEVDLLTYHLGENVMIPGLSISRTATVPFVRDVPIGPSLRKLILDLLLFAKAVRALRRKRYDLLHTHEEASVFGLLLAKRFGIPHLYDMHSSLPEQLRNFGYARVTPLIRLFEWLERRVIVSCNGSITICPALHEHVKKVSASGRHVMIENVIGEDDAAPVSEEALERLRAVHSMADRKVVLYTGTLESYQGIDLLIGSAEHVVRMRQDVLFLVVGGAGNHVRTYRSRVTARGLSPHFCVIERRPASEMSAFIRLATVLVSPRTGGANTPLKLYSYLKSGKPIVATNILAHTQILTPDTAILTEATAASFAHGILRLLHDPILAEAIGCRARQVAQERYSIEHFIEQTRSLLDSLASRC